MGRPPKAAGQKRKKQVKDPNKPKRPTSAYFFFIAEKRAEAAAAGRPVKQVAQWTKEVSKLWKDLTQDDAACYHTSAAESKAKYEVAMQEYSGKQAKAPGQPKKPLSAYFLFLADFRRDNKDEFDSNKELLQAAGVEWKGLSEEEKRPYDQQHLVEKKKYEAAMNEFNAKNGAAGHSNGASAPKKQKVVEEEEDEEEEDDEEEEEEEDDE